MRILIKKQRLSSENYEPCSDSQRRLESYCFLLKLVLRSKADRGGGGRGSVRGSVPWVGSPVSRGSVPVFFFGG